jgi:hypothetical protein
MTTPRYCMGGGSCLAFGCYGEHLFSRCESCGYVRSMPCADAKNTSAPGGPPATDTAASSRGPAHTPVKGDDEEG